ncbi:hypothetical protein [Faecalibacterium sp. I3-3-89]|uniref:hypothetical protein n=1 Tax=Faecalibacterium sp. I3-3-89 TaxID=2929493 RepID=UPI002014EA22|nr:hypothetical protein [Faecalibacterium sp. I3-3-89]UQK43282.1 hypothetical protein MTP38_01025 [Faecalibacterium sp. I3-3-89]
MSILVIFEMPLSFMQPPQKALPSRPFGPYKQSGALSADPEKFLHSYYNKAVNGKPAFLMRNL